MGYRSALGGGFNPTRVPTGRVVLDRTHPLAQGLTAQWLLNGNTADLLGKNNGTIVGSPAFVRTSIGTALQFFGSGSVSIPDSSDVAMLGDFTFSAQVNASWSAINSIASKATGNAGTPWDFWANSSYFEFWLGGTGTESITGGNPLIPAPNAWNNIVVTLSGTSLTFFLNGVSGGAQTAATTRSDNVAKPMLLGNRDDNAVPLVGFLQNVSLRNRAITTAEAAWLAAEPFAMLRPVVRRLYSVPAVVIPPPAGDELLFHPVF